MPDQQSIDLEARIGDLERQLAELAAKVNPLYSGGMDRYIHSGYIQWDGIGLRLNDNGIQVLAPAAGGVGIGVNGMFFMSELVQDPGLANDSTAVFPRSALTGFALASSDRAAIYMAADGVFNETQARVRAKADSGDSEVAIQATNAVNAPNSEASITITNPDGGPATATLVLNGSSYDLSAGGGMSLIVKEADETVNNSAALQNDDELLFAVAANEVWQFEGVLFVSAQTTEDFKLTFTGPTGAVGAFGAKSTDIAASNAGTTSLGNAVSLIVANNAGIIVHFWGGIHNGANAGNLTLQWAQDTAAGVNTTVRAGSYIKYQAES